jgi:hypothetical protein
MLRGCSYFSPVNVRILNHVYVQLAYLTRQTLSALFPVVQKSCSVSDYFYQDLSCAL